MGQASTPEVGGKAPHSSFLVFLPSLTEVSREDGKGGRETLFLEVK